MAKQQEEVILAPKHAALIFSAGKAQVIGADAIAHLHGADHAFASSLIGSVKSGASAVKWGVLRLFGKRRPPVGVLGHMKHYVSAALAIAAKVDKRIYIAVGGVTLAVSATAALVYWLRGQEGEFMDAVEEVAPGLSAQVDKEINAEVTALSENQAKIRQTLQEMSDQIVTIQSARKNADEGVNKRFDELTELITRMASATDADMAAVNAAAEVIASDTTTAEEAEVEVMKIVEGAEEASKDETAPEAAPETSDEAEGNAPEQDTAATA